MKYKAVIGLEMHCEMSSNSKVFSDSQNSYSDMSNIYVSPVDMGFPGILPTVNKECVRKAIMASLISNCKIPNELSFDRKNYYYPDLPKGYQITQMHNPIGINGNIDIVVNGKVKNVLIHDIHLEEDSASLEHLEHMSLINYNRSGVPLLELVTEPVFNDADEAVAFLETIRKIYQYADISEADTKKGQIRCDVNVSIMDFDSDTLGTKVEVKNVNSFKGVRDVINYEIERQSKLKMEGKYDLVEQETRRWDEESMITKRMRSKVDAIDYKYFVEPNIPKHKISEEWIDEIKSSIPKLPLERKKQYINEFNLCEYDTDIILKDRGMADYFEKCVNIGIDSKVAANYLNGMITSYLNKECISISEFYLKPEYLKEITDQVSNNTISSKQAKDIFYKSLEEKIEPKEYLKDDNKQLSNEDELRDIINNILGINKSQIEEYKNGKSNLFGYFVGCVMKETKGKANPQMVNQILNELLNK